MAQTKRKEVYLGVIQLIGKVFGAEESVPRKQQDIIFSGQTRIDAKRAMLRYWSRNQNKLGMELNEFRRSCRLLSDDRTIVFKPNH